MANLLIACGIILLIVCLIALGIELDGSKGVSMSFRPWDGQLRQPVLLATSDAVVDSAPGEGVLHPKNNLDTLGADAPEKLCKAR